MKTLGFFAFCAVAVGTVAVSATAQSGSVWQMQDSGTTAGLRGIDSVDGTNGMVAWASGTGGTVLRTTDGGAHWQRCATPDADKDGATLDFRGVQAWDRNSAVVMSSGKGDLSRLYLTTDGCETWKLVLANPDKDGFWDAYKMDRDSAILLGDPVRNHFALWRTNINKYANTSDRFNHTPRAHKGESAFAASNSAVFVESVYRNFWIATGGVSGSRVIRRVNHDFDDFAFDTFPSSVVPVGSHTESSGVFSVAFREEPPVSTRDTDCITGVAVGGDYLKPDIGLNTSAFSADSGKTWIASTTPPHGYRSAVQWRESLKAWITVGTNGSDISRDDGKTWQALDNGNWNALSLPFVVGPNGRIARLNPGAIPPGSVSRPAVRP
jgi:hypothetical protein